MNRVRPFAELLILAALATGASPNLLPGSGAAPRVQVPEGSDLGTLDRETSAESIPLACSPPAGSEGAERFSGGPAGTLIVGAALLAAVALILAVVIRW